MSVLEERVDSMVECRTQDPGMQWLSGRVLDWRSRGLGFESHQLEALHCVFEKDTLFSV